MAGTLEWCAGAVSAGLLLIGVALVLLQIVVPRVLTGDALNQATGPTWWRAVVQLGAGVIGEACVALRPRWARSTRVWAAAAVLTASIAALWWCWWS